MSCENVVILRYLHAVTAIIRFLKQTPGRLNGRPAYRLLGSSRHRDDRLPAEFAIETWGIKIIGL